MNSQALKMEELDIQEPELIDVDMPFSAIEVEEATSKRYVEQLTRSDMPIVRSDLKRNLSAIAAELRKNRAAMATDHVFDPIDVDMPFSAAELTALVGESYVGALGRSDMPVAAHWVRTA